MDPALTSAARALRAGQPLAALGLVALRTDAHALALRGIALAQLQQWAEARRLLRRAARRFGRRDELARARCTAAEAEIALAARDVGSAPRAIEDAVRTFAAHGDRANAAHARVVLARWYALLGRVVDAERALDARELRSAPPAIAATAALASFELAVRRGRGGLAASALARAEVAAVRAGVPALTAEVRRARRTLELPSARLVESGRARALRLEQVEALLARSDRLLVDACRRCVRAGAVVVGLARRPVLFALVRALAAAWPGDAARAELVARAFGARHANESHRARLRVEVARLRRAIASFADVRATPAGFALRAAAGRRIALLEPPVDGFEGQVLALLADGEAWSTSAIAAALGSSQRNVQRSLSTLVATGQVRARGAGRSRRWLAPPAVAFTTALLLPRADEVP